MVALHQPHRCVAWRYIFQFRLVLRLFRRTLRQANVPLQEQSSYCCGRLDDKISRDKMWLNFRGPHTRDQPGPRQFPAQRRNLSAQLCVWPRLLGSEFLQDGLSCIA